MRRNTRLALLFTILLLLVLSAFPNISFLPPVHGLSGWGYQRQYDIIGASGAGTNYPIYFNIYRGSGTNDNNNLYLNNDNASTFPNDINFTDNDESTPLDFLVEDYNSSWAGVWVEVQDDVSSGTVTIYAYYGKSGVTSPKNSSVDGEKIFTFFDHFPGASVNSTKWNTTNLDTGSVSNSVLLLNGTDGTADRLDAYSSFQYGLNISWRCNYRILASSFGKQIGLSDGDTSSYIPNDSAFFDEYNNGENCRARWSDDGTDDSVIIYTTDLNWHTNEVHRISGNVTWTRSGAVEHTQTSGLPDANLGGYLRSRGQLEVDWCLIRKYVNPEPTVDYVDSPPSYQNIAPANGTAIDEAQALNITGQGRDGVGLDYTWLATNESGTWKNYTECTVNGKNIRYNITTVNYTHHILRTPDGRLKKIDGKYCSMHQSSGGSKWQRKAYAAQSLNLANWTGASWTRIFEQNGTGYEYYDPGNLNKFGLCDWLYIEESAHPFWFFYVCSNSSGEPEVLLLACADTWNGTYTRRFPDCDDYLFTYVNDDWSDEGIENVRVQQLSDDNWIAIFECESTLYDDYARVGIARSNATFPNVTRGSSGDWMWIGRTFTSCEGTDKRNVNPALIVYGENVYVWYEVYTIANKKYTSLCYSTTSSCWTEDTGWTRWSGNPVLYEDDYSAPGGGGGWNGTTLTGKIFTIIGDDQGVGDDELAWGGIGQVTGAIYTCVPRNYSSPQDMADTADTWLNVTFTWQNSSIGSGQRVYWRIFWNDTVGNTVKTGVFWFRVGAQDLTFTVSGTFGLSDGEVEGYVSDSFLDETKISGKSGVYVNTEDGFVRLALSSTVVQQWNYTSGYRMAQGYPIGDTDNDGLNELFFEDNRTLTIYKWNGTAYELNYTIPTLFGTERLTGYVCGDTNGDGNNEVVISWYHGNITIYEWNGTDYDLIHQYEQSSDIDVCFDVNIGECNNDTSSNEIVICNAEYGDVVAEIVVLSWNGTNYVVNGTYNISEPPNQLGAIRCAIDDVDNDGQNEIVFSKKESSNGGVDGYFLVLSWNGTHYAYTDSVKFSGQAIYGIDISEVDGDNTPEILVGNQASSENATIWLYEWNGTAFEEKDSVVWENEYGVIEGICFGNFDDDSDIEVVATTNSSVHMLFWNGTALEEETYSPIHPFQDDDNTPMAMIGDTDNDGIPELVVNDLGYAGNNVGDIWVYKLQPQSTGTLHSTNLLFGQATSTIDTFNYTVSSLPAQTTLHTQFSQDNSTWYNATGESTWQALSSGTHQISLSSLGWTGANFYYRCAFNNTDDSTPKLDYIAIRYTKRVIPHYEKGIKALDTITFTRQMSSGLEKGISNTETVTIQITEVTFGREKITVVTETIQPTDSSTFNQEKGVTTFGTISPNEQTSRSIEKRATSTETMTFISQRDVAKGKSTVVTGTIQLGESSTLNYEKGFKALGTLSMTEQTSKRIEKRITSIETVTVTSQTDISIETIVTVVEYVRSAIVDITSYLGKGVEKFLAFNEQTTIQVSQVDFGREKITIVTETVQLSETNAHALEKGVSALGTVSPTDQSSKSIEKRITNTETITIVSQRDVSIETSVTVVEYVRSATVSISGLVAKHIETLLVVNNPITISSIMDVASEVRVTLVEVFESVNIMGTLVRVVSAYVAPEYATKGFVLAAGVLVLFVGLPLFVIIMWRRR